MSNLQHLQSRIRFGLTQKVFLALLVVAMLLVALVAGVLYWSFQRSFLEYVRRLELERLDPLAAALVAEYPERGNWHWLRQDGRRWRDLLLRETPGGTNNANRGTARAGEGDPGPGSDRQGGSLDRFDWRSQQLAEQMRWPHSFPERQDRRQLRPPGGDWIGPDGLAARYRADGPAARPLRGPFAHPPEGPPGFPFGGPPGHPRPPEYFPDRQEHGPIDVLADRSAEVLGPPLMETASIGKNLSRAPAPSPLHPSHRPPTPGMLSRLSLLDANQNLVIGPRASSSDALLRPLEREGRTIGWLRLLPLPGLTDAVDLDFQRRQSRVIQLTAGAAFVLAVLVAVPLTRHLLGPIRMLTDNMAALTSGRFQVRTRISRRDELGELARGFNRLAETLEKNETLRRRWVADVAHELRTPLAILTGETDAITEGVRPWDARARRSLQAEVANLSKLVDDLHQLALSDLGALTYRKHRIEIEPLLELIVERHTPDCRQAGIGVRLDLTDPPGVIVGDPARLTQLFDNLLHNSRRYTDADGQVLVATRHGDGRVAIDVQDSAPGVPPDALPRLFERLYRVDKSRSRAHGGAGLGLSICRNIAIAHDGTIDAKPSPLGGLWIEISLPLMQH